MRKSLRDLGKSQWSSFIWGVYEGITARFGKVSMEFLHLGVYEGITARFGENLNGVPSFGGFMRESLQDLGKSQWSSFIWGVYEGITARFGENLNGVPSLGGGFTRESNSCLKGAGDEYSHGPMRPTV